MGFFHLLSGAGQQEQSIVQAEHALGRMSQHASQRVKDQIQQWESALPAQGPNHLLDQVGDYRRRIGEAIAVNDHGPIHITSPSETIATVENRVTAYIPEHIPIPWLDGNRAIVKGGKP